MRSEFLELDNPAFDLAALTARSQPTQIRQPTSLFALTLREVLVIQPPLAPNERLPRSFLILEDLPALTIRPLPNYSYKSGLGFYVHPRHEQMYELAFNELYDPTYITTHGTMKTLRLGCNGPLCRRIRNITRFQAARLREARESSRKTYSHIELMRERYSGLQRNQPIYAAVEPLLEIMTFWAHEVRSPENPNQLSDVYLRLFNNQLRHKYMLSVYAPAVEH